MTFTNLLEAEVDDMNAILTGGMDAGSKDYSTNDAPPANNNPENTDQPAEDNTPATPEDNAGEENTDDGNLDGANPDDDISIDTSLDIGDDSNDTGGDTIPTDTTSSTPTTGEGEENKINTNMFTSLSAEEQAIKITELKRLFTQLHSSCEDMLDKINNIDVTSDNIKHIDRITSTLSDLKEYIMAYVTKNFIINSYYQNDVMYNRFLTIFNSVSVALSDISNPI